MPDTPKCPPCPHDLTGDARAAWKRFAKLLSPEVKDVPALQLLCETWAEWQESDRKVKELGLVVKQPNGWDGPNPYLAIRTKASATICRLLREFGLTPAARAKLLQEPPDDAGELEI